MGSSGNALESFLFLNPCGGVKTGKALLEADLSDGQGGDVDGGLDDCIEVCSRARLGADLKGGFDAGLAAGTSRARLGAGLGAAGLEGVFDAGTGTGNVTDAPFPGSK